MAIIDNFQKALSAIGIKPKAKNVEVVEKKPEPHAAFYSTGFYFSHSFNGEKNLGELGPIKNYSLNYGVLSYRAWQSFIESDIANTAISRYIIWLIGSGLKLQANPNKEVLATRKIKVDQKFNKSVESLWRVYCESEMCDYSGNSNLGKIAYRAKKTATNTGDVLVVLRYVNNTVKVQLIDGIHVRSMMYGTEQLPVQLESGNYLKNGIEFSKEGKMMAFHVIDHLLNEEVIQAYVPGTSIVQAYLVRGNKNEYRLDNVRGMPLLTVVLETLKKLERYKEATVGSAEERQKIAFAIEHEIASTGENPLIERAARAFNAQNDANNDLPQDRNGKQLANDIQVSTNKTTINMPQGAKLAQLESKNELHFADFYTPNADIVYACIGIPPDVARSKYDSNFSASRAAIKDWEHTLNVDRKDFADEFYKNLYQYWFLINVLQNNIKADGYLRAFYEGDEITMEAYTSIRMVGATVPHIDPVKEVQAARLKLGAMSGNIPLTTIENAIEGLSGGEAEEVFEQFGEEITRAKKLGFGVTINPEKVTKVKPPKES